MKKKLFDILNDDELENACLEDMSQEFEKLSIARHQQNRGGITILHSMSSSSDDDIHHSSSSNEFHLPFATVPTLSSSYNENISTNMIRTNEHCFGRPRLITTSLEKIPCNYNTHDHDTSSYLLCPSFERTAPSWYTSPSPQWRTDDQLSVESMLRKHSSQADEHQNGINCSDPNPLLRRNIADYTVKENKYIDNYNHQHRKEPKHIAYSLLNTSTPLVDDSTTILPIIQENSSNILMFI